MPPFLFPAERTGDDADIKFVEQFALGRITVYLALLLVVDGVGDIHLSVDGIYRQSVVNRAAVFEERAHRHAGGVHVHAPDVLVDPVELVPLAVELHFRGPVAQFELELLLHGERLGVDAVE